MATRTFGTKDIYHVQSIHRTKTKANTEAKWLRQHGNNARVAKVGGVYKVYTCRSDWRKKR